MSITITLHINNMERTVTLEEDISLAVLLARLIPQHYQHIDTPLYPLPLWVLLNSQNMIPANNISASRLHHKSIVTFPFAYNYKAFRYLTNILCTHGIIINTDTIALCTFTLYIWFVQKINNPLERAFTLTQLYPHLFKQPHSFAHAFRQIIKDNILEYPNVSSPHFEPTIKGTHKEYE